MSSQNSENYYDVNYFNDQKIIGKRNAIEIIHNFSKFIKETDAVLDFGCGGGYLLNELICGDKYGIDINPIALAEANKMGIQTFTAIEKLKENSVDVVISNSALEHDPNPRESLKKLFKVLKKNGKIIFRVPHETLNYSYRPNDWNYHLYTWSPMALGNLFNDVGFNILECKIEKSKRPPVNFLLKNSILTISIYYFYRLVRIFLDEFWIKEIGVDGYTVLVAQK
jgi:SAM-dependent methyltransferase